MRISNKEENLNAAVFESNNIVFIGVSYSYSSGL